MTRFDDHDNNSPWDELGDERWDRGWNRKAQPSEHVRAFENRCPEDVRATFLALTSQTCPYRHELERFGPMLKAMGFEVDALGNGRLEIPLPGGSPSTTGFCAHMDDVSYRVVSSNAHVAGDQVSAQSGQCLGADDKAGMAVLLHLIQARVPGRYMFFVGEEKGMIGSGAAADAGWGAGLSRLIAFDRRGTSSVITNQLGGECCSETFALSLAEDYRKAGLGGLRPDPTGSFTDSAAFMELIPECTNISVGYQMAHGPSETQDLAYLERLAHASVRVDWEALPTVRRAEQRR